MTRSFLFDPTFGAAGIAPALADQALVTAIPDPQRSAA